MFVSPTVENFIYDDFWKNTNKCLICFEELEPLKTATVCGYDELVQQNA